MIDADAGEKAGEERVFQHVQVRSGACKCKMSIF